MIYVKAWETEWKPIRNPAPFENNQRRVCYKGFFLFGFLPVVIIRRRVEYRWAR